MRRTLLLSAALLVVPAARAADGDVKDIIAKAVKAHGGEEKLTRFKAGRMKTRGKIKLPMLDESEFTEETSYMLPDKFKSHLEREFLGRKVAVVTIANGDTFSLEINGTEAPITDRIKKSIDDDRYLMKTARLVGLLKDKDVELSSIGEVKVEGKPCLGVLVKSKGYKDVSLFFDKETHLLAKTEFRTVEVRTRKEVTEERIILEYSKKDVEGFTLPKKILVKHDGEKFMEAEVTEANLLEKIDDGEFKK